MTHNLNRLPPADAEALLLAMCPRIGDHAPELARRCGYLPLTLRVSAALLAADETYAVAHYLTQLEAEHQQPSADPKGDPHDPAASVTAALALSYAALPTPTQQAFAQLAVFVGSFDLPAALAVVEPTTQDALADTLALLVQRSLLHYDADTARYTQPDLLRAYGRTRMSAPSSAKPACATPATTLI
ncbi:MAG: hypothetical protein CV045_13925 [Cyanobacteria bacterium M5B4]|nr:MAG: hypothetical protein CV045_13925 [Cyanobacteria bacterium M5B4]